MTPEGKVRVVVESTKVPARTIVVTLPIVSTSGLILGSQSRTVVVYDRALGDHHRRAITEAKKLSCSLDLDLEVIDRSRLNPLRRVLFAFGRNQDPSPSLLVAPSTP